MHYFPSPWTSEVCRLPLFDHTALQIATAWMQQDLDDRFDLLARSLEFDPYWSTWATRMAARQGIALTSRQIAARWCMAEGRRTLNLFGDPPSCDESETDRTTWRHIYCESIAQARRLQQEFGKCGSATGPSNILDPRAAPDVAPVIFPADADIYWLTLINTIRHPVQPLPKSGGEVWEWDGVSDAVLSPPWLLARLTLRSVKDGKASATFGVAGVTEYERKEWFRPHPQAELLLTGTLRHLRRAEVLEEQLQTLVSEEKLTSLYQFAYGASHEINNPLANIASRAQSLLRDEERDDRRRKLMAIHSQALRGFEMLADLMLFADPPEPELGSLDVTRWLEHVQSELGTMESAQGRRIEFFGPNKSVTIEGDENQLTVALKAICQNGLEVSPPSTGLTISAMISREGLVIRVQDLGPGLSPEAQRHAFDPFYSGREAGRGLGFGLCKAWRIVRMHHGTLTVESRLGFGCTWVLTLPTLGTRTNS